MSFKGDAIYNPSGKAGEYSYWACNFHVGCSNGCEYCYLKKGRGKACLGGNTPVLKKCFRDEDHALKVFEKELLQNVDELRKHGLFFTFTSDPFLPETILLTQLATRICLANDVPVKFLTKRADWHVDSLIRELKNNGTIWNREPKIRLMAFGFTLTGHDELEPFASPNSERIEAMKKLHEAGFKTFVSIEPVVDIESSKAMILQTLGHCDHYKIGLMSGGKEQDREELFDFIGEITKLAGDHKAKIYWKQSIRKYFNILDFDKEPGVSRDYNMFVH